ncbi:hypothetical protein F542_1140 [Bibersteinia trehalosi USDA-ARS-USMARC-188]|uniref:Uncharacterized protein n=1 Tax=Bibersteinia trehalosi USDA-ARS-USMARC-188 TaxID=1263829 RepID=A0A4V7I722_BIBTR|nr:hypothetical protein F542_1140 [Bibersteinia trehalosi USDA-ARS-USMARC-188]
MSIVAPCNGNEHSDHNKQAVNFAEKIAKLTACLLFLF